jgi:hypothetical protein
MISRMIFRSSEDFQCNLVSIYLWPISLSAYSPVAQRNTMKRPSSFQCRLCFDRMAHRDAAAIKAPWSPGGVLVMLQEAVLSQLIVEYWANRVATSGTTHIEERIDNPQIRIDHDLAMVWAPFDFYIDGKLDHCGRDLFNLTRNRSGWQIVALAATTRKDCTAN